MDVLLGCTGWGYDDWRGGFYPAGTPAAEYLARYARVFRLAEVDSTYYRAPSREQVARWAAATPPGFTFTPKVPGAITHQAKLRGAEEAFRSFLEALAPLARRGKLGPVLLQMPPSFTRDRHAADLDAFLAAAPAGLRLAVELRHASWWRPDTMRLLARHDAALVWSQNMHATAPAQQTTDFLYVRLVGDRELTRFDRIQRDRTHDFHRWRKALDDARPAARAAYLLVNNHFMGHAPATADLLAQALGLPRPDLGAAARDGGQRSLVDFG